MNILFKVNLMHRGCYKNMYEFGACAAKTVGRMAAKIKPFNTINYYRKKGNTVVCGPTWHGARILNIRLDILNIRLESNINQHLTA